MVCVYNYLSGSYICTFLSCLRCCVFLNGSFQKNMQTLCLRGRHSEGGDWSAKWNMFAFQIHTVKQHSLHLFKTLVMSFNTTSRLPLLPPHVSLLVDNASGHFVLHCTALPVNFQRNARLTLWKLWTLSKIISGDEHLNWHETKFLIVWSTKADENLQK